MQKKRGRKSKAEEMGLQKLLDECITPADRKAVIRKLVELARRGNMTAIELLLAYLYGKPKDKQEHSGKLEIIVNYSDLAAPTRGAADD